MDAKNPHPCTIGKVSPCSRAKRSVQYRFVPLPRPESNWLCPRTSGIRHPLNSLQIRLATFFFSLSFSDSDTFKPAHSHSCSPHPTLKTFVSRVPSQGLSDCIFYCMETKSHLEPLVSAVRNCHSQGLLPGPPIKSHPPPALILYFLTPPRPLLGAGAFVPLFSSPCH